MNHFKPFILLVLLFGFLPGCIIIDDHNDHCPRADGHYDTQVIPFPALKGFELNMDADVHYTYGSEQQIIVNAESDVLEELSTDVHNGIWEIELKRCLRHGEVDIDITTPFLNRIELAGNGTISSTNTIATQQDFDIQSTGSGDMFLSLEVDDLDVDLTGSGQIDLEGIGDEMDVFLIGSGDMNAFEFEVDGSHLEVTGSGDIRTTTREELWVKITGSGDVYYKGDPDVSFELTGSGDLIDAN